MRAGIDIPSCHSDRNRTMNHAPRLDLEEPVRLEMSEHLNQLLADWVALHNRNLSNTVAIEVPLMKQWGQKPEF
jgi:hypothetical protein